MSIKIAIDGALIPGTYRVDCECGQTWTGEGCSDEVVEHSPALPIAESIVHMRLEHEHELVDLRFSERFKKWLAKYWQAASMRDYTRVFSVPRELTGQ